MANDVLTLAQRYKSALEREDVQALSRIIRAYVDITDRLQGEIDALALEVAGLDSASVGYVQRMDRYKRLMLQAQAELTRYEAFLNTELRVLGRGMVERGIDESQQLLRASAGGNRAVVAGFRDLPAATIERLLGFLDPDGPLYDRLRLLAPHAVDMLSNAILQSVALGRNPRAWAKEITNAFGVGLTDSLRMARTVQLYAYRESSRANYIANSDVVQGWVWFATLDDTVCASCVAQHGQVYPLEQSLNDHHNGRCMQIPITRIAGNPVEETGAQWFEKQDQATQETLLGKGRYEAYKEDRFQFGQLSTTYQDEVYGEMRREATLKELTGE